MDAITTNPQRMSSVVMGSLSVKSRQQSSPPHPHPPLTGSLTWSSKGAQHSLKPFVTFSTPVGHSQPHHPSGNWRQSSWLIKVHQKKTPLLPSNFKRIALTVHALASCSLPSYTTNGCPTWQTMVTWTYHSRSQLPLGGASPEAGSHSSCGHEKAQVTCCLLAGLSKCLWKYPPFSHPVLHQTLSRPSSIFFIYFLLWTVSYCWTTRQCWTQ